MIRARNAKWLIAAGCLCYFLLLALTLDAWIPIDQAVYRVVYEKLASPAATVLFSVCTMLASPIVLGLFCLSLIFFMPCKEYRIPVMLSLSVGILLNLGLKHLVERIRPVAETALVVETGYSFPSGHTMAATCFYGFLMVLVFRSEMKTALKTLLGILLSLIIFLVGLSRIYLGVHYFSDVLGGFLISACLVILNAALTEHYFTHPEVAKKQEQHPEHLRLLSSFRYAFEGVMYGMKAERNMVIHFAMLLLVVVFGATLGLSGTEWMICLILFGLVFATELMNTAVETVVDIILPEYDVRAKAAKDTAAGAVLMVSIAAAIVGLIIFMPKLLTVLQSGLQIQGSI